ncbi:MAG: hypothetical protein HUJ71_10230 [Pseudobutyrivibrio sp.]|nr:hypothetical protein [Pseudobutyrivibrio sp.]
MVKIGDNIKTKDGKQGAVLDIDKADDGQEICLIDYDGVYIWVSESELA